MFVWVNCKQGIHENKVNNMSAAEKSAKDALKEYKCTLGGGTEWYTAGPLQYDIFIKTFEEAVACK